MTRLDDGGIVTTSYSEGRSGSLANPDYWWYRARKELFRTVFAEGITPGAKILEIGSADGPSADWLADLGPRTSLDIDRTGLEEGGVCASADALPFQGASFDVVAAFDVIEHLPDEGAVLGEIARVLRPSGLLLASVPAYEWAWSRLDDIAGHHRRYTRRRLRDAVTDSGFEVMRITHGFGATFPFFAIDRLRSRLSGRAPERPAESTMSPAMERFLLRLSSWDRRWLQRSDLAFGSSILLSARRS